MYFHFKSLRISFIQLVKLQESTKLRQSRTIQVYVSPFGLVSSISSRSTGWNVPYEQTTKFYQVTEPARLPGSMKRPIECFHSRDQWACFPNKTKENVSIRIEFNSRRSSREHQEDGRSSLNTLFMPNITTNHAITYNYTYYLINFCNLIGWEQRYFSLIWIRNTYLWNTVAVVNKMRSNLIRELRKCGGKISIFWN